jgi:hypothetical protein
MFEDQCNAGAQRSGRWSNLQPHRVAQTRWRAAKPHLVARVAVSALFHKSKLIGRFLDITLTKPA